MIVRTGTAVCALLHALSACTSEPKGPALTPEPGSPTYDRARSTGGLPDPLPRDDSFRRGVSLDLSPGGAAEQRSEYKAFLDHAVALGATDLQLIPTWSQHDAQAAEVTPHPATVDDALLGWVMREAKKRSLRVFLMPTLQVEGSEGRRAIDPKDADRWWWSYRRFVLHYARTAGANGADLLAVGNELPKLEGEAARWRKLIGHARKYFRGDLTYSASGDRMDEVTFWDALDVVGVAASLPLGEGDGVSDTALKKAFAPFAERVRGWARPKGHRYVFTDVSYSAPASAGKTSPDAEAQLRCFRALYEVWQRDPALAGLFVSGSLGGDTGGYGLHDQPAEKVIAHWFKNSRKASKSD